MNLIDRRKLLANLKTRVPERLLQLNSDTRLVQATNKHDNLKVYLYFSEPVLNSSLEVLNSLEVSEGTLLPMSGRSLGNRKFGFVVSVLFNVYVFVFIFWCSSVITVFSVLHLICKSLFQVTNVSGIAIITVSLKPNSIISRQGNPVSQLPPVTFLYGKQYF